MKIRDRVTLGSVAGLTGGLVAFAIKYPLYKVGWSTTTWVQRATGVTVSNGQKSAGGRYLGAVTMLTLSAVLGIGQTYLFSYTGRDNRFIKAGEFGFFSWLAVHGLGRRLTSSNAGSPPKTSGVSLVANIIDAFVTSEIINRFGAEELFKPDEVVEEYERHVSLDRQPGLTDSQLVH